MKNGRSWIKEFWTIPYVTILQVTFHLEQAPSTYVSDCLRATCRNNLAWTSVPCPRDLCDPADPGMQNNRKFWAYHLLVYRGISLLSIWRLKNIICGYTCRHAMMRPDDWLLLGRPPCIRNGWSPDLPSISSRSLSCAYDVFESHMQNCHAGHHFVADDILIFRYTLWYKFCTGNTTNNASFFSHLGTVWWCLFSQTVPKMGKTFADRSASHLLQLITS